MKRGTAAKVILGKDTLMDVPAGIVHGTDVILGGKAGLLNDFGGLVLSNNLMIGKKVSRGTITTITVRGQSPLVLPDAISGSLQAVKAFGGTEQDGTPTPDAAVDIVSNNGVLRIQGSATGTVTQTGNPTPTTPVEPEFYQNHGLLLRAIGTDADTYDASTQTITRNIGYHIFDGTESFGSSSAYGKALYVTSAAAGWGADKAEEVLCNYFAGQPSALSGSQPLYSCFFNLSGHFYFRTEETATDFKAWLAELYANGTPLIVWFVKSTPETESFTPSVYADGTVETIKLLYNHWDMTKASYSVPGFSTASVSVAQDGTFSVTNSSGSSASRIQLTLSASALGLINGQKYTLKVFILDGNAFKGSCVIYHGSSYRTYSCDGTQTTLVDSWTQSADNDVKVGMLYFNDYAVGTTVRLRVMVIAGETEPDTYQPYIENTATTETLLKVGDYQDVQSIIDGVVTRNVGVKVLNGTEDGWTKTNNSFANSSLLADKKIEKSPLVCSHFQYNTGTTSTIPDGCVGAASAAKTVYFRNNALSTAGDWEQWLADQYAAGTPVIVVYPLATTTTESVAGQPLQVQAGDNVLEITQASLDNLELEATYKSLVQLTIQEVEDANLNNNVEVTIS